MTVYIVSLIRVMTFLLLCDFFLEMFGKRERLERATQLGVWTEMFLGEFVLDVFIADCEAVRQIAFFCITSTFMWTLFREKFKKILLLVALYQVSFFGVGYLIKMAADRFLVHTFLYDREFSLLCILILQGVLYFSVVLILRRFLIPRMADFPDDKEWMCFLVFPFFTVVAVAEIYWNMNSEKPRQQKFVLSCIALGLAVMNVVIYYLMKAILKREKQIAENRLFRQEMRNEMRSYQNMSENYERQRRRIHEFNNHMTCILALARQRDHEKLQLYLEGMQAALPEMTEYIDANHALVNAILNSKYQEAREKKITFVFKINDLSGIHLSDQDIVVLLCNLLNNAFEACEHCSKKIVRMKFVREQEEIVLSVANTSERAPSRIGDRFVTSKAEGGEAHGLGIENIKETVRKYSGEYAIRYDDGMFQFIIMIPQKSSIDTDTCI